MRGAALIPPEAEQDASLDWCARLVDSVGALARRYPRTCGSTIPETWGEDAETVELLALITRWRAELDAQEAASTLVRPARCSCSVPVDGMLYAESGIEQARRTWAWRAQRDAWLARLAEKGNAPLCTGSCG